MHLNHNLKSLLVIAVNRMVSVIISMSKISKFSHPAETDFKKCFILGYISIISDIHNQYCFGNFLHITMCIVIYKRTIKQTKGIK